MYHGFTFAIDQNLHLCKYIKLEIEGKYKEVRYFIPATFDSRNGTIEIIVVANICVHRFFRPS